MAERKSRIPRETKIGLLVIFVLMAVFAYVVIHRVRQPATADTDVAVVDEATDQTATQAEPVQVSSVTDQQAPAVDPYTSHAGGAAQNELRGSYYQQAKNTAAEELPADRYAFMPAQGAEPHKPVQSVDQQPETVKVGVEDVALPVNEDLAATEQAAAPPAQLQLNDVQQSAAGAQQVPAHVAHDVGADVDQQPPAFAASQQAVPAFNDERSPRYADAVAVQNESSAGYESTGGGPAYVPQDDYRGSVQRSVAQQSPAPIGQLAQVGQTAGGYLQRSPGGKYHVMPNDNFWTIAEKLYGSGSYFKALMHYNRQRYPVAEQLAVGDQVLAPPKAELIKLYPDLCPKERRRATTFGVSTRPPTDGRIYIVQEGDTLFDIARYELGDPSRWVDIYQLNAQQLTEDFNYVRPGLKLIMPGRPGRRPAQSPERFTQQSELEPPLR